MINFVSNNKKCSIFTILLLCASSFLQGMFVDTAAPTKYAAAATASSDFPSFITFTQKVLKECPEYNCAYNGQSLFGDPEGLDEIVTPEQFNQLTTTFINNLAAKETFITEPYLLQKAINDEGSLCFIGDIHGSIHSLIRNIWTLIARGDIDKQLQIINPSLNLVFLGDYIDNGRYNLLTLALLLKLSNNNPDNVFLIRGNHEDEYQGDKKISSNLTLETEKTPDGVAIQLSCEMIFSCLPIMIFFTIEKKGHIRCCHGGGLLKLNAEINGEQQVNEWLTGGLEVLTIAELANATAISYRCSAKVEARIKTWLKNRILWGDFKSDNSEIGIRGNLESISYSQAKEMLEMANSQANPKLRLLAIFRGHQDYGSDLKFLVKKLNGFDDSYDGLLATDSRARIFTIKDDGYLPIFTLSSASEGKSLPVTSCIFLNTAAPYEAWQAERLVMVLGNEGDPHYPFCLRHYPDIFEDDPRKLNCEGLFSQMTVNPKSPSPITLGWDNFPYKNPLVILTEPDASPAPELTPTPEKGFYD